MKTLVINGSTRANGDTQALLDAFLAELEGDVKIVTWQDDISPCVDCRTCWIKPGCTIRDDMQEVYDYLTDCDNVVLASPIWFSSLSGPMLNITSRLQTLFMGRFRRGEKHDPVKNGVLILTGAQPKTKDGPEANALTILRNMRVKKPLVAQVYSLDTDHLPARQDEQALADARRAGRILNELYRKTGGNEE